jgi:hypothetical protein
MKIFFEDDIFGLATTFVIILIPTFHDRRFHQSKRRYKNNDEGCSNKNLTCSNYLLLSASFQLVNVENRERYYNIPTAFLLRVIQQRLDKYLSSLIILRSCPWSNAENMPSTHAALKPLRTWMEANRPSFGIFLQLRHPDDGIYIFAVGENETHCCGMYSVTFQFPVSSVLCHIYEYDYTVLRISSPI